MYALNARIQLEAENRPLTLEQEIAGLQAEARAREEEIEELVGSSPF